jgi:hypothetical protein
MGKTTFNVESNKRTFITPDPLMGNSQVLLLNLPPSGDLGYKKVFLQTYD